MSDDVTGAGGKQITPEELRRGAEEAAAVEQETRARLAEEDRGNRRRPEPEEEWPPHFLPRELGEALHLNLKGDAELFSRVHRGRLLFDNKLGTWWRYDTTRWVVDDARHSYVAAMDLADYFDGRARFLRSRVKRFNEDPKNAAMDAKEKQAKKKYLQFRVDAFAKRASALRDDTRVNKLLKAAGAGPDSLGISGTEWNQHPTLFAAGNAVLDLRTGKTVASAPEDYINMASAVEWQGLQAECKLWLEFLDKALDGNQEMIDYAQLMAGYFLTGLTTVQEFYCLWGPRGRNGKGVFFRALRSIMGDYYTTIPAALLLEQRQQASSSGPREDLMHLRSRRLAVASESNKKARFSEDAIKGLTGGDPINCRPGYGKPIEYLPEFKLLFVTNRIPSVDGGDEAFRQRLRVILFPNQFLPGVEADEENGIYPQDPELETKLQPELPGILAWAVRGAMDFLADMRLTPPACVLEERDEIMGANDLVGEYIEERLEKTDGSNNQKTPAQAIYDDFRKWCLEVKHIQEKYIMAHNNFGQDFKVRPGIRRVSPRSKVFYNVVIVDDQHNLKGGDGTDTVPF